jgi:sulfonate transport system permease protein
MSYGVTLRTRLHGGRLALAGLAVVAIWEIIAEILHRTNSHASYILPTISQVVSSFKGLSTFWHGGLGAPAPEYGGARTILGAFLALGQNGLDTLVHLTIGLTLGVSLGVGLGILIGCIRSARRAIYGPVVLIAQLPTFALLPMFQFWFGATSRGAEFFIAFGSSILLLRATVNAIENVWSQQIAYAQTLGARGLRLYRTVIIPAILPELRGAGTLALTLAWTLALGGELIGVQSGLGHMLGNAATFAHVGQMVFIAALFVVMAATSIFAFNRFAERVLGWTR